MTGRRTTIVAHPGVQHSADLARALDASGDLLQLVTGLQVGADAAWPWSAARAQRGLQRRTTQLDDARIARRMPLVYAGARGLRRWPGLQSRIQSRLDGSWFAAAVLRQLPPDVEVVVGTDFSAGPLFDRLRRERPDVVRVLDVSHPNDEARRALLTRDAARWDLRRADYDDWHEEPFGDQTQEYALAELVVVASAFSASQLPVGLDRSTVRIVPYGIEVTEPPAPAPGNARPRVLFVGALSERKGISLLLRAARELAAEVDVDLVGQLGGAYVLPSDLPSNVRWHRGLDNSQVAAMFRAADLFVLPAMCEGFGRVLLEALAHGTPVLATTASGAPDIKREVPRAPVSLMDPDERGDLAGRIRDALAAGRPQDTGWHDEFAAAFSPAAYQRRWSAVLREARAARGAARSSVHPTARSAARTAHNAALAIRGGAVGPRRIERRIAVLGTGRSGTTALMEAIAAATGGAEIYEPFRPASSRAAARVVPWHEYPRVAPDASAPELEALARRVFDGRALSRWSAQYTSPEELGRATTLVVKDVRLNRSVGWLERVLPEIEPVVVVRHPVDVVASMLAGGVGWKDWSWSQCVAPAAAALNVEAADLAAPDSHRALWLMAVWIADTRLALLERQRSHVIAYEDLLADPATSLAGVMRDGDALDRAVARLASPSAVASPRFVAGAPADWSGLPVADMLGLARSFGLDFYGAEASAPTGPLEVR
ncbi:glycosyltransferase family 4 protein [Nocardioides jejuensis]|uniref:Glycosyltransferase n=1 Tax=Nocardioides jejuensis TaxID=2502782 RepID=A0A4R1CG76_9ACTN|nr:glycosyltransferase family 4 protein [Nocardioides jejuensis]TCJ30220.1 glycosyltransferase [Nocardioides jejuensis]